MSAGSVGVPVSATRSLAGVGVALVLLALATRFGADVLPPSGAALAGALDAAATVSLAVGAGMVAVAAFLATFGRLRSAVRR